MMTFWQAVWHGFSHPWLPIQQFFCRHRMYIENISRVSDNCVIGTCYKCKRPFAAPYGLAFMHMGVTLDQKPKLASTLGKPAITAGNDNGK